MPTREELVEAMREARRQGRTDIMRNLDTMIQNKEYDEEVHDLMSAGLGIAQGATFGLSDEAWAGLRAASDRFLQGEPFKQAYERRLEENRALLETARREDPWAMGLGEVGGGMLTGGAGAVRSLAGQGLKQVLKRAGTAGAGAGALAGYGYSEGDVLKAALMGDEGEFLTEGAEALQAAAEGGAIGGALGVAMPAIGMAGRGIARGAYGLLPFSRGKRLQEGNRLAVIDAIEKDIAAGDVDSWDDMARKLREDPTMTIADVGGTETKRLAEGLMHSGTPAGARFRNFVRTRNVGQWRRMHPRIAEALGEPDTKTFGRAKKKLLNDAKTAADEMYGMAYAQNVRITPEMAGLLKSPAFKGIRSKANALYKQQLINEGIPVKDIKPINLKDTTQNTQHLDFVLRALDDRVGKLYKAGDNQMAKAVKDARNRFRGYVYDQNPTLREARNQWASDMAIDEAMDQGRKIFREDFEMVGDLMKEMSEGEKVGFRVGVAKALTDRMGNKPYDADITKGVFNIPAKEQAVRAAFGSRQKFDDFMKYVGQEQEKFELYRLSGGPDTARRIAEGTDIGEQIAKLSGYGIGLKFGGGIPPSTAGYGVGKAYTSVRDALGLGPVGRPQLMESLSSNLGAQSLDALAQPSLLNPLLRTGVPTSAAALTRGAQTSGLLHSDDPYGGI